MARQAKKLFAGLNWASKTHMVCVLDADQMITQRFEIVNTGKTFTGLVKRLVRLGVEGVAIERCDGPLIEALLQAGLRVVVITPRQVKGLRSRTPVRGRSPTPVTPICSPTYCAPTATGSPP
jgi:transposase